MKDALESSIGTAALDDKAYHCAGRAAYELGLYEDATGYFESSLKFSPTDIKYTKELNRTKVCNNTILESYYPNNANFNLIDSNFRTRGGNIRLQINGRIT